MVVAMLMTVVMGIPVAGSVSVQAICVTWPSQSVSRGRVFAGPMIATGAYW